MLIYQKKRTFRSLIPQLIYPRRCPVCDGVFYLSEKDPFHPECLKKLSFVQSPFCFRCGRGLRDPGAEFCSDCIKRRRSFVRNVAALHYNEAAKESVSRFKYRGRQSYAAAYAEAIWQTRREEIQSFHADALIPVPIHRERLIKRGYNQAELLAEALSGLSGIPLRRDVLFRRRNTEAQKALGPEARVRNLSGAFTANGLAKSLKTVILVDDIYTTGSTMEACTRALLSAGAEAVYGVTLCVGMGEE